MLAYPPGRIIYGLPKKTGKAKFKPVFTLDELRQEYITTCMEDPTEYSFANRIADSWKTWNELKDKSPELRSHVSEWAEEANLARQAEAWKMLSRQAKENHAVAKWMAEHKWKGYISKQVKAEKPKTVTRKSEDMELPEDFVKAIRERMNES